MVQIIITLIAIGILLWAISLIPMDNTLLQIIRAVVIVATVLWLMKMFHLIAYIEKVGG